MKFQSKTGFLSSYHQSGFAKLQNIAYKCSSVFFFKVFSLTQNALKLLLQKCKNMQYNAMRRLLNNILSILGSLENLCVYLNA